jgi:Bacterial Ig-like domain
MSRRERFAGMLAFTRAAALALAVALPSLSGCASQPAPTAPFVNVPPHLTAMFPNPRSTRIQGDTQVWAEFDDALDPATVDVKHVFLKVDTRRIPIVVSYDGSRHRITLVPQAPLALLTTHTVEFSPTLRTAAGDTLGPGVFWQFTVSSLRRPRAPFPADSAVGESPFARLGWAGTEEFAGSVRYDVWAGPDSNAVASRSTAPLSTTLNDFYLPTARWAQDTTLYWSVRETNLSTSEQLDGPVWRVTPVPSSTPIDSVLVPTKDWFFGNLVTSTFGGVTYVGACKRDSIVINSGVDNALRWNFSGLSPGILLAGAVLTTTPLFGYTTNLPRGLTVFAISNLYSPCTGSVPANTFIAPKRGALLAPGAASPSGTQILFSADAFSAFLESEVRHGGLNAVMITPGLRTAIYSPGVAIVLPNSYAQLKIYFYRPGPEPALRPMRLARR